MSREQGSALGTATRSAASAESETDMATELHRMVREGASFSGHERNCCFLNTQDGRFANCSSGSGFDFPDDARAVVLVDWDLDGDLDVWTSNRNGPQVRFLRNDIPGAPKSVLLKLQGTTCNRDAVGARVELYLQGESQAPQIKTVAAGGSFLSQSSKWIHFGVGTASQVDRVVVRWPGGEAEEFSAVEPGKRFELVQETGRAKLWQREYDASGLQPSALVGKKAEDAGRRFLSQATPLPKLQFTSFSGQAKTLVDLQKGKPLLLNLWASWCAPCARELVDWTEHAEDIRKSGLEVLALSTDGLGAGATTSRKDAQALIERLKFPFESGMADEKLLDVLQMVNNQLFQRHTPLALPCSFLIDSEGRLAAIYRGTVSTEQLSTDLKLLSLKSVPKRMAAMPFPGRWQSNPPRLQLHPMARALVDAGLDEESLQYVADNKDVLRNEYSFPTVLAALGNRYYLQAKAARAQGNRQRQQAALLAAVKQYRSAVELRPKYPRAIFNLAVAMEDLGSREQAIRRYRESVRQNPNLRVAHINLSLALERQSHLATQQGKSENRRKLLDESIAHLREAIRLGPNVSKVHFQMALLWAQQGNLTKMVEHFRETLRIDPNDTAAQNQLAWVLATDATLQSQHSEEALRLAQSAARATEHRNPAVLDTLAATFAANGKYDDAVRVARQAISLARTAGRPQLAEQIQSRAHLYEQKKPFAANRKPMD